VVRASIHAVIMLIGSEENRHGFVATRHILKRIKWCCTWIIFYVVMDQIFAMRTNRMFDTLCLVLTMTSVVCGGSCPK
jgi:hypothetical protein